MKWKVVSILGGLTSGLFLLAAACAPTAEPVPQATEPGNAGQPSTATPSQKEPPKEQQAPAVQQQVPTPIKGNVSVSGIPLDDTAKSGGVLLAAVGGEGPTLNSWEEASGNSFHISHPVSNMIVSRQRWGTLEDHAARAYWNLVPDLASSWQQASDGLSWTFKLRGGVKWSDGKPFTCADAKWSLDTIRTGKGLNRSPRAVHFVAVSEIICPDDLTMVIKLKQPKPSLLEMVGLGFNIVRPKHIYENDTPALRDKPPVVGTGPFVIKDRLPGEKTVFARKADYWDKPLPYLDGIELKILSNSAQVTAMRGGRLDIGGSAGAFGASQANVLARECKDCQVFPKTTRPGVIMALLPNQQRPPWNTPEIKDAMSLAIDRKRVIQVGSDGWGGLPTGGLYLPGSFWAMPYERVKQIPGYDFENVEANRQKARGLLDKMGYKPGDLKVEVVYSVGTLNYEPSAIPTIEDLKTVGIAATAKPVDTSIYYDMMSNGNFEVGAHAGFIGGFDPDFILYEFFYTGSDRNYGRYSNPEFDRLVDLQSRTVDPQERRRIAWDASEIALRDQVRLFAGFAQDQAILGPRMRGYLPGDSVLYYGSHQRHDRTWLVEK